MEGRRKPLSMKENEKIADFFLYEVGTHGQGIRRREAITAGLSYVTLLEETGLDQSVQKLFEYYAEIMKLFVPFLRTASVRRNRLYGDNGDYDIDGNYAAHTPIVMIESEFETNPAFPAYGHSRHWDVPPSMQPSVPEQPTSAIAAPKNTTHTSLSWESIPHVRSRKRQWQ